jgi:hypothetical protein
MKPSKRFTPNRWTELVVPAVLLLLSLALVAMLGILILSFLPLAIF